MIVTVEIFIYCIMCIFIGLSAIYLKKPIVNGEIWAIVLTSVVVLIATLLIISLVTQPTSNKELSFKVPLVPLIPALSILVNIYLMLMLDSHTWIRFAVWMAIGLPVYYFSIRPYTEAQNKNISNKSSIDYNISMVNHIQNGKLNGHTNFGFVSNNETIKIDDSENQNKEPKKKPAPQPPPQDNAIVVNNEIPPEVEELDEMLEEVYNTINSNSIERKLSVGTLSNVSDIVSREENVVAVVHRDNVITPANSNAPPSPTDLKHRSLPYDSELTPNNTDNTTDNKQIENVIKSISETPLDDITQNEIQNEAPNNGKQNLVNFPVPSDSTSVSVTGDSLASDEDKIKATEDISQVLPTATPPPSLNTSPVLKDKAENVRMPVPPPLPMFIYEDVPSATSTSLNSSSLPNDKKPHPYLSNNKDLMAVPRPTSANLNSVCLRHVTPRKVDDEDVYEPDDDNLKVGSDKYKSFMEKLNGKLQNLNVLPAYIPFFSKRDSNVEIKIEKKIPNENVIEKSLGESREEAKERLSQFLTSSPRIRSIIGLNNEETKMDDDKGTQEDDSGIQSNNDELTRQVSIEIVGEDGTNSDQNSNNDYMDHKNRMQNAFRSINLKKSESSKDPPLIESRTTKSLGSSFMNDDKVKHRQAMGEIFKSIKLRRKDSKKQDNDKEE